MIRDYVLEIVAAPGSGLTITLPNTAPTGRRTWAQEFGASVIQKVFYILDDSIISEEGWGWYTPGSPGTITRDFVVRNSAGTQPTRLNFTDATRCFNAIPAAAALYGQGPISGNRNLIHNGGISINQRTYVSGTAAGAGTPMFDRWKAGAGGCTATFPALGGPFNRITITAGTMQQVIAGTDINALFDQDYTLSWQGTAQARINAGAYANSPITVTMTAGAGITVEFGTGNLNRVQLETGDIQTDFERRNYSLEMAICQRFLQWHVALIVFGYGIAGTQILTDFMLPVPMRAAPTVTPSSITYSNASTLATNLSSIDHLRMQAVITATGSGWSQFNVALSSEL